MIFCTGPIVPLIAPSTKRERATCTGYCVNHVPQVVQGSYGLVSHYCAVDERQAFECLEKMGEVFTMMPASDNLDMRTIIFV